MVEFNLNGEEYNYTSKGIPMDGDVMFSESWINNDKFLAIHLNINTPSLFSNGLYLKLSAGEGAFYQHKLYPMETLRVINKYGRHANYLENGMHTSTVTGSGTMSLSNCSLKRTALTLTPKRCTGSETVIFSAARTACSRTNKGRQSLTV
ncbi:MAG: hypothetical protein J5640_04800 [Bacteroidales bacterium]|nr:hypothetical protein [Bacteroidales bacterium]